MWCLRERIAMIVIQHGYGLISSNCRIFVKARRLFNVSLRSQMLSMKVIAFHRGLWLSKTRVSVLIPSHWLLNRANGVWKTVYVSVGQTSHMLCKTVKDTAYRNKKCNLRSVLQTGYMTVCGWFVF